MASYKTEWVQPSYGCCYMSKSDHEDFLKTANGGITFSIDQLFSRRQSILTKYRSQYPFKGDGKLFNYTDWDNYEETLPIVLKVNVASTEEQKARNDIIDVISVNSSDYTSALVNGIPSASDRLKRSIEDLSEQKSSSSRRKNEGVAISTGNVVKATSIVATPELDKVVEKINEEVKDSNQKAQPTIKSRIKEKIALAKTKFTAAYSDIKESIETYKAQIAAFIGTLQTALGSLQSAITTASNTARTAATQAFFQFTNLANQAQQDLQNLASDAVSAISGAFSGVATLIGTATGFAAIALETLGVDTLTQDARVSDCTEVYPNGVDRNGCTSALNPASNGWTEGKWAGYNAKCYTPRSQDNHEEVIAAERDAKTFADSVDGYLWNDCGRGRFVVFWEED